jgi:hypothetical protein
MPVTLYVFSIGESPMPVTLYVPLKKSSWFEWPVRCFRLKADGWYVRLSLKVLLV